MARQAASWEENTGTWHAVPRRGCLPSHKSRFRVPGVLQQGRGCKSRCRVSMNNNASLPQTDFQGAVICLRRSLRGAWVSSRAILGGLHVMRAAAVVPLLTPVRCCGRGGRGSPRVLSVLSATSDVCEASQAPRRCVSALRRVRYAGGFDPCRTLFPAAALGRSLCPGIALMRLAELLLTTKHH
ncbi:hypothetical protein BU16DRAFT_105285 [Lophium mytilinum]|uniref:Uncharacterized protein n=1 Tax=Lophium mytilinum TaxID=390894 RepID=A0A6A6QJ80_9PEZI|nr:hypothetical protein BU16DRAFT_105285 [Lophium mytilinum]